MTPEQIYNILKAARQLGYPFEKIGDDLFRVNYADGDFDDWNIEEIKSIVDRPPPGWVERHFGPYPPLKTNQYGKPIALEDGGFDWAAFDKFTDWMIQQEERVVDAPQYFTGDNAWEEADAAARAATEESGGEQEWEVVGVPARDPTYYIEPVKYVEQLLETKRDGTRVYGYKETDQITRYEYPAAPGAPPSTYLGRRTNESGDEFHATGYIDENDDEQYTHVVFIPKEDPTNKFLGEQLINGKLYYAWGYIDSDNKPVVIDAELVPTEDPTETLLRTETDASGRDIEIWGHRDPDTGQESVTNTRVLPTPKDPTQKYLGRETDDQGREVDLYGHYDPKSRRNVITGRQYLQDIEPDEVFLGTVDDGGWRIDQYGYTDPDTGRPVVTRRQAREPIRDPILSVDDMIAQALGKVDDWSDLSDTNLQRAQSLFDFKNQPTDAERLRLAMDIAQSPSDYMTLVGLYTGAISRESPARAGERLAPLAPYLQQMAQKFFLDVPGINEMAPIGRPAQPAAPSVPPTAPSVTPTAPSVTPQVTPTITTPTLPVDTTQIPTSFDPETATSSLPFHYQTPRTEALPPSPIETPISSDDLSADPDFLAKMYSGMGHPTQPTRPYPIATGVEQGTYPPNKHLMLPTFQQGGIVPGPIGSPQIIQAHGGETVIPNPIQGKDMLQGYDVWRPPSREFSKWVVKPGTKGLIPSLKESAIRFRSPQTIRHMTPSQRMLFQEDVEKTLDVPYEDWRMQEMLATGAGGSGRPRIQFRRPSFVRG